MEHNSCVQWLDAGSAGVHRARSGYSQGYWDRGAGWAADTIRAAIAWSQRKQRSNGRKSLATHVGLRLYPMVRGCDFFVRGCLRFSVKPKEENMRGQKPGWNGSLAERFEAKYIPEPNSGCWLWIGAIGGRDGRPMIGKDSAVAYAHRVAWELYRGEVPDGMSVLHTCDVPSCVNPDHLWLGTQDDNMKDCAEKGRIVPGRNNQRGETASRAKLTERDVLEIRTRALSRKQYAAKFGIHWVYVKAIQRRDTWKHI